MDFGWRGAIRRWGEARVGLWLSGALLSVAVLELRSGAWLWHLGGDWVLVFAERCAGPGRSAKRCGHDLRSARACRDAAHRDRGTKGGHRPVSWLRMGLTA